MNPLPYFHSHVRNRFKSEFHRVARECQTESEKKRADDRKRRLALSQTTTPLSEVLK